MKWNMNEVRKLFNFNEELMKFKFFSLVWNMLKLNYKYYKVNKIDGNLKSQVHMKNLMI